MITSNYLDIPESDFMDVAYMFMSVYYKCYSTDTKCLVRNESWSSKSSHMYLTIQPWYNLLQVLYMYIYRPSQTAEFIKI